MIGCLCIHGFTGAPFEVEPLVLFLQEHTNWRIVTPTLPGHGETLQLKGIAYQDWIDHAEKELKSLLETCEEVYVIGFSMGGMIASYLAVHYPVDKLVLLSAAAYYMNPKQLALDIKEMVKDTFRGGLFENEMFLRYKRKIKETPLAATMQFRRLVSTVRPLLSEIQIPTFIAQGNVDGIVPPKSAQFLFERISATEKKIVFFQNAKHLICHCPERNQLFEEVFSFLKGE
ncbi:alpha/beta hydrolase [Robertmurraya korlensis]|uniref:alpha/beta hydrolase n=1 Tax=Robertmurraya korlensis TaxID=519977 RepID=UPI0008256597|nr:alpha/beta fold hydrolase [Robertmurraya korlensis]